MPTEICRHVRVNGSRCGSPALRHNPLCYFHDRINRLHGSPEPPDTTQTILHPIALQDREQRNPFVAEYFGLPHGPLPLDIPPLEDRESIQIALSMVITAMARHRIDLKLATGLLYGLSVASANTRNPQPPLAQTTLVRDIVPGNGGQLLAPDEDPEPEPEKESILSRLLRE